jgi:hypothetical protein
MEVEKTETVEKVESVKKVSTPGKLNSTISVKVTPEFLARIRKIKSQRPGLSEKMRLAVVKVVESEEASILLACPDNESGEQVHQQ